MEHKQNGDGMVMESEKNKIISDWKWNGSKMVVE
jgi:hypothetical protein